MRYAWSPWDLLSCLFVVSEVDLVVGLGRVLHDPLAQLIRPVRHLVPCLIGKYIDIVTPGASTMREEYSYTVFKMIFIPGPQCCGSALVSMRIRIRIQLFISMRIRIRILIRLLSHKKLNFYIKFFSLSR